MTSLGQFDLEQRKEFLARSLDDLEAERAAGDIEDRDYDALRTKYRARAAEVDEQLRSIADAAAAGDGTTTVVARPARGRKGSYKPLAAVLVVVVLATIAGFALASSSGERVGQQASSGSIDVGTTDQLAQARDLIGAGKALDAIKLYDKILKTDPKNPEALAYRGWLVRLAGLSDDGLSFEDLAIAADPSYPDAHFFRGMILWQDKHQPAAAVPEFQTFLASNPPQDLVTVVQGALKQAMADAAQTPASTPPSTTATSAP